MEATKCQCLEPWADRLLLEERHEASTHLAADTQQEMVLQTWFLVGA